MQALISLIDTTSRTISRLVGYVCVAIIFVMLGLLVTQVLMRYFLGAPPSWTEELAIILFAWLVLLFATVGLREGFHVGIDILPQKLAWLNRWTGTLVASLTILFGWITVIAGIAYVDRTSGQKTAALQMPIETLYLCVPVCGALFILHGVALLLTPVRPDEDLS